MSNGSRIILVVVLILIAASAITMGLFNFLKKTQGITGGKSDQPITPHTEDWAPYLTTIDNDKVGSILVDLGLRDLAPAPQRPYRLLVHIELPTASENGLPTESEYSILSEIEDTLTKDLTHQNAAIFPGHLYSDATASLYFYLPERGDSQALVDEAMKRFPSYTYKTQISKEEQWETYFELLYPLPIQMQSIQNRKLISRIASQGDQLEKERQIDHWIYFSSDEGRSKFENEISGKGFKVETRAKIDSTDGKPFQLHISRADTLTPSDVDEMTQELWQTAHGCDGDYDGWETSIVTN